MHIIEDDRSVRDAARELVRGAGREVFVYDSPHSFFAGPPIGPKDIVLLDLHFPVGSGVETAQRVKQDAPGARIIILSGIRGAPYARALAAIAPAASFRKPIDGDALIACIEHLAAS
ncbi:MAG: response regulator [Amphiplicatus sp.]